MKLQELVKQNNLALSKKSLRLAEIGIHKMSEAKDKSHGVYHVYHIFDNLNYLLSCNSEIRRKINFDVLILAICWHDVWISTQTPKNIFNIIYLQVVEGISSAKIFKKEADKIQLDRLIRDNTYYVIRKHSSFQILPAFMLEAQILFDLDKLEMWNYKRFFKLGTKLVAQKQFYQKSIVRLYYSYSQKMGLYINDFENKFKKISNKFWKKMKD